MTDIPMDALALGAGLCAGSFVNVCIHRLPLGESLVRPRSRCPRCGRPIPWHDNVPILSWLLLRGRCRRCREPISMRYPAVELLTGLLFMALRRRWEAEGFWFVPAASAAAALVAVAFIDWDTFLIPDALSLGLLGAGLLTAAFNPYFSGPPAWRLAQASLGGAVGFALCRGTAALGELAFKREALGGGDVKLLAAVGVWSGALGAFDCLVLASLVGAVYGGGLMLRGRIRRYEPIPFGPFLSAAAIFNLFYRLPLGFLFSL